MTPQIPRRTLVLAALFLSLVFALPLSTQATSAPTLEPTELASDTFTTVINPLVGKPLAAWGNLRFVDAPKRRTLEDFRGKALVIRFWTAGCPRCRASAATLARWARQYRRQNLEVIAILLPQKDKVFADGELRSIAQDMGWNATIAVDQDWSALDRLWAKSGPRYSVSVGLLVDPDGVVRAVHHGGYLSETDPRGRIESRRFHDALDEVIADSYTDSRPSP